MVLFSVVALKTLIFY